MRWIEELETRRVLSAPPVIGGLVVTPDPVTRGAKYVVTAQGVSDNDGTVKSVEFFIDTNRSGGLDAGDKRLGKDANGRNGWSVAPKMSTNTAAGVYGMFARATDNSRDASAVAGTTMTVANKPPTVQRLTAARKEAAVTVTLVGAKDADGKVTGADFYLDANGNGQVDEGVDTLLAADRNGKDGWKASAGTGGLPAGTYAVIARAVDSDGAVSNAVGTTVVLPESGVDLVITSADYTPKLISRSGARQSVRLTMGVSNLGASASGPFKYEVRLSRDDVWGNGDDLVVTDPLNGGTLQGGQSRTITRVLGGAGSREVDLQPGNYYVLIKVDSTNAIAERNEGNNVWAPATANFVVRS